MKGIETRPTFIVGPNDAAREELRSELLALAEEAKERALRATTNGRPDLVAVYLGYASYVERIAGGAP